MCKYGTGKIFSVLGLPDVTTSTKKRERELTFTNVVDGKRGNGEAY